MKIEQDPHKLDIVSTNIDGCGYTADGKTGAIGALEGEQILGTFLSKRKEKKVFSIKEVIKTSPERVEPLVVLPMFAVVVAFSMQILIIK